jgi:Photoprotection regulator fluorescence recovery protein
MTMANLPHSESLDSYTDIRTLKWSQTEKAIARKAFEHALQQELEAVIQETQRRAEKIEQPSDLWELEGFLTKRRNQIDRKYDYRYSVLPEVFGQLVREGRVSEEELHGLAAEKLAFIRKFASFKFAGACSTKA